MHSKLFEINIPFLDKPFVIHAYGAMLAFGLLCAVIFAVRRAKKQGIPASVIHDVSLYAVILGIIGARIHYVIRFMLNEPHRFLDYFAFWQGGLVFQGGFILAFIGTVVYLKSKKVSVGKVADCFAPGLAIGYVFARIGCFMNGCCFGAIAREGFPWAVTFPEGSPAYDYQMIPDKFAEIKNIAEGIGYEFVSPNSLPFPEHPVQIYSSIAMLAVFATILFIERLKLRYDGMLFIVFVMLYSVQRFIVEFWRMDTTRYDWSGGLNSAQFLSIAMFIVTLIIGIWLRRLKPSSDDYDLTKDK